ncbi:pyridoxamine 5'-phosphate oxidase family protein [Mycolicibacterium stellerae]|uniref:pyridoxamine 5'-phosphate oxidase family protein n=1 Tax=Mycolicibacterium stellerae TaxID=2358193 RepID=UPI000F0B3358|nr:pyridoxamine 5'-phosphate oxidase family protein [Mycolicibacterium stellerae]
MSSQQIHTNAVGFHSGELAVQRRAGVEAQAARLRPMMAPGELRGGAPAFVAHASFAAIGARDRDGRLWTSPLIGPPGFMAVTTPTRLSLRNLLPVGDPLHDLPEGQPVGIVLIDFASKRRVRINGTLAATDGGGLAVDVVQAYGNCPQYIHPRRISAESDATATASDIEQSSSLGADDIALIHSADTFFLGTTHPERGNDASHRGGPTGFVHADHNTVEWPDYPGNNMFNSFGNLEIDPTAALLFVDFESGRTLQMSGRAVVDWEKSAGHGDTGRWVRFTAESVVSSRRP